MILGSNESFTITRPAHASSNGTKLNIFGQDSADGNFGGDIVMRAGRGKASGFQDGAIRLEVSTGASPISVQTGKSFIHLVDIAISTGKI